MLCKDGDCEAGFLDKHRAKATDEDRERMSEVAELTNEGVMLIGRCTDNDSIELLKS